MDWSKQVFFPCPDLFGMCCWGWWGETFNTLSLYCFQMRIRKKVITFLTTFWKRSCINTKVSIERIFLHYWLFSEHVFCRNSSVCLILKIWIAAGKLGNVFFLGHILLWPTFMLSFLNLILIKMHIFANSLFQNFMSSLTSDTGPSWSYTVSNMCVNTKLVCWNEKMSLQ